MRTILNDDKLLWEVETAICTVLRVSGPAINPGTPLIGGLGTTSADLLCLARLLEKTIDSEIDLRKLLKQHQLCESGKPMEVTVQEVVDYLKTEMAMRSASLA